MHPNGIKIKNDDFPLAASFVNTQTTQNSRKEWVWMGALPLLFFHFFSHFFIFFPYNNYNLNIKYKITPSNYNKASLQWIHQVSIKWKRCQTRQALIRWILFVIKVSHRQFLLATSQLNSIASLMLFLYQCHGNIVMLVYRNNFGGVRVS